jgi:hypothetical protein
MDMLNDLKERDKSLNLELDGDTIFVKVDGFRFGVADKNKGVNEKAFQSSRRMNKFFTLQIQMLKDGYGGRYAIVMEDLSIQIVSTEDEAINIFEKEPNCFFSRIVHH